MIEKDQLTQVLRRCEDILDQVTVQTKRIEKMHAEMEKMMQEAVLGAENNGHKAIEKKVLKVAKKAAKKAAEKSLTKARVREELEKD